MNLKVFFNWMGLEDLFQKNWFRAGKHLLTGRADGGSEFGGFGGLQAGLDDVVHQRLKIFESSAVGFAVSFEQRGAFENFHGQLMVPGYGSSDAFEPVVDPMLLEGKTVRSTSLRDGASPGCGPA